MMRIPSPNILQPRVLRPLSNWPLIRDLFDVLKPSLDNHIFEIWLYIDLFSELLRCFDGETPLVVVCFVNVNGAVVASQDGGDFGVFKIAARGKVAERKSSC